MKKYKITQVRSKIGRPKRQKDTLEALGLKKLNKSREIEGSPQVLGMLEKVKHLVTIEEV